MSKNNMIAVVGGQISALKCTTNRERLQYTIAKVEDGICYDSRGNSYGVWDGEDVEFITEADLALTKITATKISKIDQLMKEYFGEVEKIDEVEKVEKIDEVLGTEEELDNVPVFDEEAATQGFTDALKAGKLKKARKFLDKLAENGVKTKKLEKKYKKASK